MDKLVEDLYKLPSSIVVIMFMFITFFVICFICALRSLSKSFDLTQPGFIFSVIGMIFFTIMVFVVGRIMLYILNN